MGNVGAVTETLARIHSHRKGKSHSIRPTSKRVPSWVTHSPEEVEALIVKLAKSGLKPSEIGVRLRDEYNIPLVKPILGKSITEVLKENNLLSDHPEDLERLINRATRLQEHLRVHKNDRKNVRSLELLEAKIHRLSKYYKRIGRISPDWKYSAVIAQLA
ncbi:MAG: 30S ribosomal protein S15 [Nitrososphaerales archaeon]